MKWEIKHFNSLSSTNLTARDYPVGTVVLADVQTDGRGRYGRIWHGSAGNLYASFVFDKQASYVPYLSFITGLALAESLPELNVRLKWPNDVLLDGAKVAGILLEVVDDKVIVGVGVNVVSHPVEKDMLYPVADLSGRFTAMGLLNRLMLQLDALLDVFQKKGFDKIRKRWLDLAVGVGDTILVQLPTKKITGIFKGIGEEGALLLKTKKGLQNITVGDVFFNLMYNFNMKE